MKGLYGHELIDNDVQAHRIGPLEGEPLLLLYEGLLVERYHSKPLNSSPQAAALSPHPNRLEEARDSRRMRDSDEAGPVKQDTFPLVDKDVATMEVSVV